MTTTENLANNSEVSEKAIERYLCQEAKKAGMLPLKYSNPYDVGYPDRLLLMPGGWCVWVEVKSKGRTPSKVQRFRHRQLREIKHHVYVIDSRKAVDDLITELSIFL